MLVAGEQVVHYLLFYYERVLKCKLRFADISQRAQIAMLVNTPIEVSLTASSAD